MLPRAVTFAIVGESLIRYTEEVVLPRIDASLAELSSAAIVRATPPVAPSTPGPLAAAREGRGHADREGRASS
jgi:hypothetical protein